MKKLNSRGSVSMATMVGFLCVFILFLLIVAILAHRYGVGTQLPKDGEDNFVPIPTETLDD